MKAFNIFLFFLLLVHFSYGQNQTIPENLSLEQAKELAIKNNPDYLLQTINTNIAVKQIEEIRTGKLPEVFGNYDLRRNLIIPTTPVPAIAFDPTAQEGELLPLKFSSNWMSNMGLNAKVNLFNPVLSGQIKEAGQMVELNRIEAEQTAQNLRYQTTLDYAALAIAERQLAMAAIDTLNAESIRKIATERLEKGTIKVTELNQTITAKNTTLTNYYRALNIRDVARAQLLADMGFDPMEYHDFKLNDDLERLIEHYQSVLNTAGESLTTQKWEQEQRLNTLQIENTKANLYPTLSLNGFLGANFFDNKFHIFDAANWYGNSFVNLSLNIPLTASWDRAKKVEILKLQSKAGEAQYRSSQNRIRLELSQTLRDIQFKETDLELSTQNLNIAQQDLETAQLQYEKGRLLNDELTRQQQAYQQAKNTYLQSVYDLLTAKIKLEKLRVE